MCILYMCTCLFECFHLSLGLFFKVSSFCLMKSQLYLDNSVLRKKRLKKKSHNDLTGVPKEETFHIASPKMRFGCNHFGGIVYDQWGEVLSVSESDSFQKIVTACVLVCVAGGKNNTSSGGGCLVLCDLWLCSTPSWWPRFCDKFILYMICIITKTENRWIVNCWNALVWTQSTAVGCLRLIARMFCIWVLGLWRVHGIEFYWQPVQGICCPSPQCELGYRFQQPATLQRISSRYG